ncbi:MAG: YitT family protein [Deltaproteobacteria bacterium]|nr:YitT family protein [Deltaproteobacteria bacterium]
MGENSTRNKAKVIRRFLPTRDLLMNLGLLTAGSFILAFGVNAILVPHQLLSGGALGISLIFHYLFPGLGVGFLYLLANIPFALLGWFSVSRRFMYYTAFGIAIFSFAASVIPPTALFNIDNHILAAILAGIICGIGVGILLRSAGSGGGLDILAVYLNKKWEIRLGWTYALFNSVILVGGAIIFSLEMALYTLIYIFTMGKVINAVITGFNQRKQILIVSDQPDLLAQEILKHLNRGVTFLEGEGAYTHKSKRIIFSIVSLTELARMKDLIFEIDPHAFVVINDTLEVLGYRHGSRRAY